LCSVLDSPETFAGKTVTVSATYRVAFENSELYCLGCDKGLVWAVLSDEGGKKISKLHKRKHVGATINGVFTGVLEGPGRFGHMGAYRYQFKIDRATSLKLIADGIVAERLDPEKRKLVCHDSLQIAQADLLWNCAR
jgi:hypothetical protein